MYGLLGRQDLIDAYPVVWFELVVPGNRMPKPKKPCSIPNLKNVLKLGATITLFFPASAQGAV